MSARVFLTSTEKSVRRAIAIQMIINKKLGLNFCENPWQGSFFAEELTDLVEEQVYQEFEPRMKHMQQLARERKNTIEALMETAKACSNQKELHRRS